MGKYPRKKIPHFIKPAPVVSRVCPAQKSREDAFRQKRNLALVTTTVLSVHRWPSRAEQGLNRVAEFSLLYPYLPHIT
jgi:hypothetical protein